MNEPLFKEGDKVRLKTEPARIGVVLRSPMIFNGQFAYRVSMDGGVSNYAQDDLEPSAFTEDPRELFLAGNLGDRASAVRHLTYLRISGNLSNYYYSFHNSRTKFYPHQFKPLVKFVDSPRRRILLADEVGLGKTIEAGHVLLELDTRRDLRRALIVCPAKLRVKWRTEMSSRFGFEFEVLTGRRFQGLLREIEDQPDKKCMWILSYESMRGVLGDLEGRDFMLDIVVADEAHRLRNRETAQHKAFQEVADKTDALLLLTATPINNRSEDLFNLLHFIEPDMFRDFGYFQQLSEVNSLAVNLERIMRTDVGADPQPALDLMRKLEGSRWSGLFEGQNLFARNVFFTRLKKMLEERRLATVKEKVEAQRLASKVNLLSGHIVRTRRRDVEGKRPEREAHLWKVAPAPEEQELYLNAYRSLMQRYRQFRLPVMTMERILSSCMAACVEKYGRPYAPGAELEMEDFDWEEFDESEDWPLMEPPPMADVLARFGKPLIEKGIDTKFDNLIQILEELDRADPGCKVIVFSYFKATIAYLQRRLGEKGYPSLAIHGDVPTCPENPDADERERIYRQFAAPGSGNRILISSEVGSEGLDFQFAHVVVNYDLPWNPMRVEQRIGRIDRIGQQAERILIYSLVTKGTIDEMIYDKLLAKIRIFEECVGDLESILGNEIAELRDALFNPQLTEAEKAAKTEETAQVLQRNIQEAEELEKERLKVIGTDQYLKEEIRRIRKGKRFIGPDEIRNLLHFIFESPKIALAVEQEGGEVFGAELTDAARKFFNDYLGITPADNQFRVALRRNRLRWTFDYDVAYGRRDLELVNLRHPAMQAVARLLTQEATLLKPAFIVKAADKEGRIEEGYFILAVFSVRYTHTGQRLEAPRIRNELVPLAWEARTGGILDETDSGHLMSLVLSSSNDLEDAPAFNRENAAGVMDRIEERAYETVMARKAEIEGEENAYLAQRKDQIVGQARRRIAQEEERKAALVEQSESAKALGDVQQAQRLTNLAVGADKTIAKHTANMEELLGALPEQIAVTPDWKLSAVGTVLLEG